MYNSKAFLKLSLYFDYIRQDLSIFCFTKTQLLHETIVPVNYIENIVEMCWNLWTSCRGLSWKSEAVLEKNRICHLIRPKTIHVYISLRRTSGNYGNLTELILKLAFNDFLGHLGVVKQDVKSIITLYFLGVKWLHSQTEAYSHIQQTQNNIIINLKRSRQSEAQRECLTSCLAEHQASVKMGNEIWKSKWKWSLSAITWAHACTHQHIVSSVLQDFQYPPGMS